MPKLKNVHLFDESDGEEGGSTFKTNTSYAKHYDEFRKKEILSHLKNISDDDSSSEDASTDEELVDPEFDKEFLKSLAFLKSKDPSKYEKIPKFFENVATVEESLREKQQNRAKKPLTVADYQRERLIKTEGRMSEEEDEVLPYTAEQEKIKSDLKQALEDSSEDEDMFKVKEKPEEEVVKEREDYLEWLAGQKKELKVGEDAKALAPLKDFWTSNQIPKADKFLRDYIVNKRYMDHSNTQTYEDVVGLSDDEEEVEKQDEFETKYNFRFEEPDNEFIKRFPRTIDNSVRVEDNKRKEKRKERQERKAQEKELKMKELNELNSIRKREIEQKLLLLKDVAGKEDFSMKEEDLNSDFDPAEHDRRMAQMFNNEYYGIDEGDQKPEFPDIDEELNIENWDNFDKSKIPDDFVDHEPHCEDDDFMMDCDYDPEAEKKKKIQNELIEMTKGKKRKKKISKLAEIIKQEKPAFDPESMEKTYEEYLDEYYQLDYEDIIGDQPCRFRYTECVPNDFGLSVEEILLASNKELNQWSSLKRTMQNRPKNVEMNDVEKYNRRRNNLALKKKIFKSMYGEDESDDEAEKSEAEDESKPKASKINQKTSTVTSTVTSADASVAEQKTEASTPAEPAKKKKKKKNKKKAQAPASNANETESPKPQPVPTPTKPEKTKKQQQVTSTTNPQKSSQNGNSKKRKLSNGDASTTPDQKNPKKMKFNKNQNKQNNFNKKNQNQQKSATDLSDDRLMAFGINPKKFRNKLKYGPGAQKQQGKQQNGKFDKNKKKNFQKKNVEA